MGQAQAEITIERSPEDVWVVVSDFGGLDTWMPGIDECTLEGDDRKLKAMNMDLVERLVRRDDNARTISYSLQPGAVPIERHMATITVRDDAAGSHVTWAVEVEPDTMVDLFKGMYEQSLGALKAHVEGSAASG